MRFSVFSLGSGASDATAALFLSSDRVSLVFETDMMAVFTRSWRSGALEGVSRAVFPKQGLRMHYGV